METGRCDGNWKGKVNGTTMDQSAPSQDQRLSQRHRVLRQAQIIVGNAFSVIDCIVRNESDGGARLALPTTIGVPEAFPLQVKGRAARPCRVVWRTGTELGIAYI